MLDSKDKEKETTEELREQEEDHTLVLTEPVPDEPVVSPHQREEGQSLVQTTVMVIGGIILVILLVLFARWVYHKVHHNADTNTAGTSQLPESSSSQSPGVSPQPSNAGGSSSGGSSSSSSQNGKTITNTGPGNVAAVFAGSTLAAAGLHYIISLRRFNKNGY